RAGTRIHGVVAGPSPDRARRRLVAAAATDAAGAAGIPPRRGDRGAGRLPAAAPGPDTGADANTNTNTGTGHGRAGRHALAARRPGRACAYAWGTGGISRRTLCRGRAGVRDAAR